MRGTSLFRRLLCSAAVVFALAAAVLPAASAAAQGRVPNGIPDRITAAVSSSRMAAIPGSVSPRALQATDLGPLPADTVLSGMSLRFTPSAAQQTAIDQLLAGQQDPASPLYHQWLTPQQYAAQFGLSSADLAKITAWLAAQGFTVAGVANGGTFVTFSGSVAQVQAAFATSIHRLSLNGETHFANVTGVSVPSAFAGVVGAVTGLHDFRLKPRVHSGIAHPQFTSSVSGNHYLVPGDIYTIYDMGPLMSSTSLPGANVSIAVTGQVDISPLDISTFRAAAGLNANPPTVQVVPLTPYGGCDPGTPSLPTRCLSSTPPTSSDLAESSIDVEWSGAMAPYATVFFITSQNVFLSMQYAVDTNVAPIVTTSYGNCEAAWGITDLISFNQVFQQANLQGQTVLVAAGDSGATDCDAGPSAGEGLAVDYPASSPNVTAMGGTQFSGDAEATGSGSTWGATQYWKGTSGSDVISSALSYIPEAVWNDAGAGYYGGGGGGASAFFTKPAWQIETGASGMTTQVPTDGSRDVPDLALDASDVHDSFLFCVGVASGTSCGNGFRVSSTNNGLEAAGGTSLDSQIFGGMLALVEQKIGSKIGNANPTLYALGNKTAYYNPTSSSVFHDVTLGSNAMQCTAGSKDCPNGGSTGYSAGTGYDLATGWGSVDLSNLATDWTLVTPLGSGSLAANTSATALAASSTTSSATNVTVTPTATVTVTLTATVTGGSTAPTGTVQFLVNNVPAAGVSNIRLTPGAGSSASAAYQYTASCSTLGQQSMSAVYSGDSTYQGSIGPPLTANGSSTTSNGSYLTSPLIVTVSGSTCPNFSLTSSTTIFAVAAGGTIPSDTINVVPANGFTGTVVFSATAVSSSGYIPTLTFSPASVAISSTASVSTTLTLSGITASLHLPGAPGKFDSGTMLAQKGSRHAPVSNRPWTAAGSGVTLACLLLLVLPRRRRLGGLLLVALSVALIAGATGCGGSSQAPPPSTTTTTNTNPYAGTYTVTVVGTYSGSITLPPQTITLAYEIQ